MSVIKSPLLGTVLAMILAANAMAQNTKAAPRCKGNPAVVGACFTVHGRLSIWNGNPSLRIWPIGTKRMLGVREEFELPVELDPYLGHFDDVVYADFEICPLTAAKPGVMQIVCVQSAKNIKKAKRQK